MQLRGNDANNILFQRFLLDVRSVYSLLPVAVLEIDKHYNAAYKPSGRIGDGYGIY